MDKKIANNLIVGIFVLIGTAVFMFILFSIGEGSGIFSRASSIYGKFAHVKGLNYGSEVSLAGLRIGTVKKITLPDLRSKDLTVEMDIQRDMMDKLRQDSVASIKTSGVLGDKYIEISVGSPESPPLKSGDFIQTEEPEDILSKGGNLVEHINKEFTQGGDLHELIANLNRVSQNLAFISTEMRQQKGLLHELIYGKSGVKLSQSMDHLAEITQNLDSVTRKINNGSGSLGALINDPTVYEDLKSMMGGAKRSTVLKYFMQKFIQNGEQAGPEPTAGKKK